ncbi:MAG: RloB family protein [Chloroflexi bacterium]|nr:RloB family protein [Chloroflexota bacterium]
MRKRRASRREVNRRIVVATEGPTERDYIKKLIGKDRYSNVSFAKQGGGDSDPDSVIRALDKAKERIAEKYDPNEEDEYWAVVDKDQWDLESAAKQVRQKKYCLAESYPCFELWLLLHFKQLNELRGLEGKTSGGKCKPVMDVLKSKDPPYQKGKVTNKGYFDEQRLLRRFPRPRILTERRPTIRSEALALEFTN